MATQWQTFPIEFRGGLISNLSPLQHGTNAVGSATILQNFEPNKEGGYSKIRGYEKFSTTEVTGSGPILALKVISSGRIIVARKNASNYTQYYYGTGTTWTSMATSAGTNGGKSRHVEFNLDGDDKVIFVDGTNYPAIYNTSGNTTTFMTSANSTDVSGAEHVAIFKNTAFYSKGNNIFFTAPFTVDDFDVANGAGSINVGTDVTGLAVFRDQLIIFTTNSIKRLTGSSSADFQVAPITDRIGCINGDTIQEVGGDIIYLAPDGLRLLSATDRIGDFALDVASDKIQKDAIDFLNTTSIFSSVILREKAQYRIFSYVSSERSDTSKGLLATKFISQGASGLSWATTKGIKAYVADSRYANDQETIAFANEDGYIYILNTGNAFDTGIIEAIYESPFMPISDPQVRKTFYKMTLYAEPTGNMNLDVNLKYDFAASTNIKKVQPSTINIFSKGNTVFEFGSSTAVFGNVTNTATANVNGATTTSKNVSLDGNSGTIAVGMGVTGVVTATANVNGATSSTDAVSVDGNSGTIEVGMVVTGTGISGTVNGVSNSTRVKTVTDQNTLVLDTAQTLSDNTVLTFTKSNVIVGTTTVTTVTNQNNIVLSTAQTLADNTTLTFHPVSGQTASPTNAATYGGEIDTIYDSNLIGSGKTVAIRIEDSSTNPTFTLDTMILEFRQNDRQ